MSENIGSYEPDKGWSTEVVEKYNEGWVAGYAEAAGRITELEGALWSYRRSHMPDCMCKQCHISDLTLSGAQTT